MDGLLKDPIEENGYAKDKSKNYFFDREDGQKQWRVVKNLYEETSAHPGSELWKKAENHYVRVDKDTILGLRNRSRVWMSCERLLDAVDDVADGKLRVSGSQFVPISA